MIIININKFLNLYLINVNILINVNNLINVNILYHNYYHFNKK